MKEVSDFQIRSVMLNKVGLGDYILKESAIFSLNVKFVTPKVDLSNFWACYSLTKPPTVFKNKNLEDADIK